MTTTPTFWSDHFLVNSTTLGAQQFPHIAGLASGGFVVVWQDPSATGSDTSGSAVRAQVYDSLGDPVGAEFLVNTTTTNAQQLPRVAALADGGFVVVWEDFSAGHADVRARRFDDEGTAIDANDFIVNSTTLNGQTDPHVAALADGGFVIVFEDDSQSGSDTSGSAVRARRYDANGVAQGNDFEIHTFGNSNQSGPSVAGLTNGGFVAVWADNSNQLGDNSPTGINARLFSALDAPVDIEFQVNTTTSSSQFEPRVAALANGSFVVVWQDNSASGFDDSNSAIRGQVFDAAGGMVGSEFLVNTAIANGQTDADVTALPDGGFFVVWRDGSETGGDTLVGAIRGQRFDEAGNRVGGELLINQIPTGDQRHPAVTALDDGRIAVAYRDLSGFGETSNGGILARILDPREATIDGTHGGDVIAGRLGDTEINGHDGDDAITGMAGDDVIDGDAGNDTLFGGDGEDLFVFNAGDGDDEVGDFMVGTDHLVLNGIIIDSTAELDGNGDAVIDTLVTLSGGDTVLLSGVSGIADAGDLIA